MNAFVPRTPSLTPQPRAGVPIVDGHDLAFLDGLRGLAALYVMIGHARWLLWEGFSSGYLTHKESYSLPGKCLVYLSSAFIFGHQAVVFFFVLSGFVIHLRYARQLSKSATAEFDWLPYMYRRAKRLYPTFVFAMVVTFVADWLGSTGGYAIYSRQTSYPGINANIGANHDLVTGIGNLAFLMPAYVPVWGTNGPLWSLTFEWWFYVIYPVFWWVSKKSIGSASGLLIVLFLLSLYPALWPVDLVRYIFSMMLVWWFGVLLADIYAGRIAIPFSRLSFLIVGFAIPLAAARFMPALKPNVVVQDMFLGLTFTGVISGGFAVQRRGWKLDYLRRLKPLGDMSYTLYVIHFPILVLMSGAVMAVSPTMTLPMHFWWVLAGVTTCLIAAYGAHFISERPFLTSPRGNRWPGAGLDAEAQPAVTHS